MHSFIRFSGAPLRTLTAASLGAYWRVLGMWLRGLLRKPFLHRSRGPLLVGSRATIVGGRYLSHDGRLVVERLAEIQGLSAQGISFGRDVSIGAGTRIRPSSYYGGEIGEGMRLGHRSSIASGCFVGCSGYVDIGDDVMVGPNVSIFAENHVASSTASTIKSQGVERSFVTIERDVWIGSGSVILPGVTIGQGAVVAAGSVVAKDVPRWSIVAGVPAAVKRYRNAQE